MSFQHNIKLPRERIAVLIGKGGRVKQDIEKKCGVQIEVDSESGDAVITSGSKPIAEMEMFKAVEIISAISRGFSPQRATRLLDEEEVFQQIDLRDYAGRSPSALARVKGRIIGEGGKSRRTIEELSGASMSVYGHTVSLIGNYREIRLATDAIDMLCRGSMHKSVYNMLQEARRHDKMDRMRLWEDKPNMESEDLRTDESLEEAEDAVVATADDDGGINSNNNNASSEDEIALDEFDDQQLMTGPANSKESKISAGTEEER